MMCRLHGEFPCYGWNNNKGYATGFHAAALLEHGPCRLHRKSFRPCSGQLNIDFDPDDHETPSEHEGPD
jgi:ribonuclease HII